MSSEGVYWREPALRAFGCGLPYGPQMQRSRPPIQLFNTTFVLPPREGSVIPHTFRIFTPRQRSRSRDKSQRRERAVSIAQELERKGKSADRAIRLREVAGLCRSLCCAMANGFFWA